MRGGPQRTRESERVREERAGLRERVVCFLHGCVLAAFLPLHSACCFARGAGGRGSGLGLLAWLVRGQRTQAARVVLSLGGSWAAQGSVTSGARQALSSFKPL